MVSLLPEAQFRTEQFRRPLSKTLVSYKTSGKDCRSQAHTRKAERDGQRHLEFSPR